MAEPPFALHSELDEDADKCGSPLREGLTLKAEGTILRYGNVAFMSDLVDRNNDDDCKAVTLPGLSSKTPAKLQANAGDDGAKWVVGQGDIYAGFFHVFSRNGRVSEKTGELQMVKHIGDASSYTRSAELPGKTFVAKDGAIALDFFKSGGDSF